MCVSIEGRGNWVAGLGRFRPFSRGRDAERFATGVGVAQTPRSSRIWRGPARPSTGHLTGLRLGGLERRPAAGAAGECGP